MKTPPVRMTTPEQSGTESRVTNTLIKPETIRTPFEQLLMGLVTEQEKAPHGFSRPPLSKENIQQLTHLVEMQMTGSLFRAVVGDDHENNGSSWATRWLDFSLPVNRQLSPQLKPPAVEETQDEELDQTTGENLDQIISHASDTYDVEPALIKAVIKAESNFDPQATSSKGAMGLMQLMPETANDLGVREPFDPKENILAGTRYLKILLDRYDGNIPLALAGYNWGMGNVERNPGKLPQETRTYIARVNQYYREVAS